MSTTTKLVPNVYITKINESKDLIKSIITTAKLGKSKSTQKQISYNETKLIHLSAYLYERTNNLYKDKKRYKGIAISTLTEIIGFSNTKQTKLHLDILINLNIITRTGKAVAGVSSFEYTIIPIDLFTLSNYNKIDFTKYEFTNKKINIKNNTELNKAISERVKLDITSDKYKILKETILSEDKQNENHITYIEQHFKNSCYAFKVATVNNRRMSVFTACKREFRELLTIDNEEVIALDFANSQPAFLANYIINRYKNNNIEITDDIKLFFELSSTGIIYEYIADKLFEGDRNKAKDLWMSAGYGRMSIRTLGDEVIEKNNNGLLFSTLFPNVIKFLDNRKESKGYNETSITLQGFESKFTNRVSDLLFEKGILNVTVYDEFIVKKSQYEKAYNIIINELKNDNLKIILKKDKNNTIVQKTKESSLEVIEMVSEFDTNELINTTIKKYPIFNKSSIDALVYDMINSNKNIKEYTKYIKAVAKSKYKMFTCITRNSDIDKLIKNLN